MSKPDVPPGVTCSQDQSSPAISLSDGAAVRRPELSGIQCSIQHPLKGGKPASLKPGLCGMGVVLRPGDTPAVMLQLTHADGTSLAAMLEAEDFAALIDIFRETGGQLMLLAEWPKGAS